MKWTLDPIDPPPIEPVIELLRQHGLIVTRKHAGRWWVRGHGVEGVLSHRGRWGGDPEPALYLDRLGNWNKMATARCMAAPRSGGEVRRMLRIITQLAT